MKSGQVNQGRWDWHGDTLGDPRAPAFIWVSDAKQVLLADVLNTDALHHFNKDGRERILTQIHLCWDKRLLHPTDLSAIEDFCRRNLPPHPWLPGLWDKEAQ